MAKKIVCKHVGVWCAPPSTLLPQSTNEWNNMSCHSNLSNFLEGWPESKAKEIGPPFGCAQYPLPVKPHYEAPTIVKWCSHVSMYVWTWLLYGQLSTFKLLFEGNEDSQAHENSLDNENLMSKVTCAEDLEVVEEVVVAKGPMQYFVLKVKFGDRIGWSWRHS